MGGVAKGISNSVSNVASTVKNTVEDGVEAVKDGAETVADTASTVVETAKDTAAFSADAAWNLVEEGAEVAQDGAEGAFDYATDRVEDVTGGIKDGVVGYVNAVKDTASGVFENLKEGDILGAAGAWVEGAGNATTSALGVVGAANPLNVLGVKDELTSVVNGGLGAIRGGINSGVQAATDAVGNVAHDGLTAIGLEGAGDFVQGATEQVGNFYQGVTDGTVGLLGGVANLAIDPAGTAQGLVQLATHPDQLDDVAKGLWGEASEHGVAGAVGYIAANLAPTILSGGATAAGTAATAAGAAGRAGTAARLAKWADTLGTARTQLGGIRHLAGHGDLATFRAAFGSADDLGKFNTALTKWQKLNPSKQFDDSVKNLLKEHGVTDPKLQQILIDSGALTLHLNDLNQQAQE
jgi:hypothetical protein